MLARPKGISLNKNALNIRANSNQPLANNNGPKKTPSPPLKSRLITKPTNQQLDNINKNDEKLSTNLQQLHQLQPSLLLPPQQQQNNENQGVNLVPPVLTTNKTIKLQPLASRIPRLIESDEETIEDIDKSNTHDAILLVCDVAKDIYNYMFELEETQSIRPDYLRDQKILNPRVRQRLINWCIDIHGQLKLIQETLYLSIAIIDRYFDQVTVKQQSQVQLVAIGAILIASKYEEIYPPDVDDLLYLTQNAYTRRDLMRIEIEILERLNFDLGRPIPLAFLRRFSKAAHCDLKKHSIAKFFMEISLTEYECAHWKPSLLAAASLYATIHLVNDQQDRASSALTTSSLVNLGSSRRPAPIPNRWNKTLVHYTHYTAQQLHEPVGTLCTILRRVLKSPQSYNSAKKNLQSISKWHELKSSRVDELIKMADQSEN